MLLVVVVVDVAMREKSGRWGGLGGWKRQQGGRDVLIMHSSTWEVWWNSKWFDLWRLAKQPIYSSVSAVNRHRHVPAPSLPHPRHCRSPSPALSHTRLNICAHSRNTSLGSVYLLYRFFLFFCVFFYIFLQNTVTVASTAVFGHCPACHHCPLSGGAAALGLTASRTLDCQ